MIESLLDQTLAYEREVPAPSAGGATTKTWQRMIESVPVSIQSASSQTVNYFAQRNIEIDYTIFTNVELRSFLSGGIRQGDRFNDGNGNTYIIRGVKRDSNAMICPDPVYEIACKILVE